MRKPSIGWIPCEEDGCIAGATHNADDGRGANQDALTHVPRSAAVAGEGEGMSKIERLQAENDRLNRLVDTLSRALMRYQEEEDEVGGDDPVDHPYQRRGSWSADDWCAVEGCTSKASAHP